MEHSFGNLELSIDSEFQLLKLIYKSIETAFFSWMCIGIQTFLLNADFKFSDVPIESFQLVKATSPFILRTVVHKVISESPIPQLRNETTQK